MKIYKLKIKDKIAIFVAEDAMQVLCLIVQNSIFEGISSKEIMDHLVEVPDQIVLGKPEVISYYML